MEAAVATTTFGDRIAEAVERKRTQLVVGLDPVVDLLPVELLGEATGPEGRVRARVDDVPIEEEVGDLRGRFRKLRVLNELVWNAGERVQLGRHIGVAQKLEKLLAALGRHRRIGETVEQDCGRKALDVVRRLGRVERFLAAVGRKREGSFPSIPGWPGHGIKSETGRELRADAFVPSIAFKFRSVRRRGSKQCQMPAGRIAGNGNPIRTAPDRVPGRP